MSTKVVSLCDSDRIFQGYLFILKIRDDKMELYIYDSGGVPQLHIRSCFKLKIIDFFYFSTRTYILGTHLKRLA